MKRLHVYLAITVLALAVAIFVRSSPMESAASAQTFEPYVRIKQSFLVTVPSGESVFLTENIIEVEDPFNLHDPSDPGCLNVPNGGLYHIHAQIAWTTLEETGHRSLSIYRRHRRRPGAWRFLGGSMIDVSPTADKPPRQETLVPLEALQMGDCVVAAASQANALGANGTLGVVLTTFSLMEQ